MAEHRRAGENQKEGKKEALLRRAGCYASASYGRALGPAQRDVLGRMRRAQNGDCVCREVHQSWARRGATPIIEGGRGGQTTGPCRLLGW